MNPLPSVWHKLNLLDWLIFIGVLVATWAVVQWCSRKSKGDEPSDWIEYMLMGRRLTLPLFVANLVATWYGGIFGVTRIAYESGIYNFITQGLFWYLAYIAFAFFLVHRLPRYEATTLPELVGKLFGQKSGKLAAVFNFFDMVPIVYTISLGILLQAFIGGPLLWNMALGIAFVMLYSLKGGFSSVVLSDLVQFTVMVGSVVMVAVFAFFQYGGLDFLQASLPASHFTWHGGHSLWEIMAWGLIAFSTLVDPCFYQRCFAATSPQVAKRGILISTLIWMVFDLCTTAGGLYARALMPNADPNLAYLQFSMEMLPNGLRGFFLAGIAATILSTIDGYILIAGTSVSYDLFPKFIGAKKWLKLTGHQWSVLFVGLTSIVLGWSFEGNIKNVWKTLGSYSAACLLFPVMIGFILPGRIRDHELIIACLAGVVATTAWRMSERSGFYAQIDEIYAGVFSTALSLLILYIFRRFKNASQYPLNHGS